jgi:hypothetical protein
VRSIILMQNGEIAFDELQTATVRESWEWDGTSWSEHYSYCCPRREAALVYELSHQRMIMFGGNGAYPDRTWELAAVWNYQQALQVAWQYPPGTFPNTYQTVRQALDVAGDCTFIDIRGGDYNETASGFAPLVITKAVRLGAFRLAGDSPTVRIH